ncbi:MAG TPA: hypothetical protein V6D34_01840, partial [Candidatus Sericytochromatia bacterium]
HEPTRSMQQWAKKAKNMAIFVGIVVVTTVVIKIATQLAAVSWCWALRRLPTSSFLQGMGRRKGKANAKSWKR